jgi:hypothetical protein
MKKYWSLTFLFTGLWIFASSQSEFTQDWYNKQRGTYIVNTAHNMDGSDSVNLSCFIRIIGNGGCTKRLTKGKVCINGKDYLLDENGSVYLKSIPGKYSFNADAGVDWVFPLELKELPIKFPGEYNITFFLVQKEIMKE